MVYIFLKYDATFNLHTLYMTEGSNMILTFVLLTLFVYVLFSHKTPSSNIVVLRPPGTGYRPRVGPGAGWRPGFRRRRHRHP